MCLHIHPHIHVHIESEANLGYHSSRTIHGSCLFVVETGSLTGVGD